MKHFDPLKFIADNRGMFFDEALAKAYEQGKIDAQEAWVSITDHLPDEDVPVLVTDDAGGMATLSVDSCGRYEDTGERFWYTSQNVTAWMELPLPYQGEHDD